MNNLQKTKHTRLFLEEYEEFFSIHISEAYLFVIKELAKLETKFIKEQEESQLQMELKCTSQPKIILKAPLNSSYRIPPII